METAFLKTLYVLFFIEIGTRRVRVTVATSNPNSVFVTQQARNLAMSLFEEGASIRFLIGDRDAKFSRSFDDVFASEGMRVTRTPIRAPNANAFAERWVETLRADCLDWTLILGSRHLDRVLRTYVRHYNHRRPRRGLQLLAPESAAPVAVIDRVPAVRRRDRLGGLSTSTRSQRDRVFAPHGRLVLRGRLGVRLARGAGVTLAGVLLAALQHVRQLPQR